MAKVLIIGGTRFVGPHLVKELLTRNHSVSVFNRGKTKSYHDGLHVDVIKGDRNVNGFKNIKNHFDVVIDMCACVGDQTTRAISELHFDFFIHLSTVAVYKKTNSFPLRETDAVGAWPRWGEYNVGKVQCERVLMQSGISYATLRPVYILGPNNYKNREQFIYSRLLD